MLLLLKRLALASSATKAGFGHAFYAEATYRKEASSQHAVTREMGQGRLGHGRDIKNVQVGASKVDARYLLDRHLDDAIQAAVGRVAAQVALEDLGIPKKSFGVDRRSIGRNPGRDARLREGAPVGDGAGLQLVRPLLGIRRAEAAAYLEALEYEAREGPSNRSLEFSRNRLRHRVLPELRVDLLSGTVHSNLNRDHVAGTNQTDRPNQMDGRVSRIHTIEGNLVRTDTDVVAVVIRPDPLVVAFDVDERTFAGLREAAGKGGALAVSVGLATEDGFPRKAEFRTADAAVDPKTGTVRFRAGM